MIPSDIQSFTLTKFIMIFLASARFPRYP